MRTTNLSTHLSTFVYYVTVALLADEGRLGGVGGCSVLAKREDAHRAVTLLRHLLRSELLQYCGDPRVVEGLPPLLQHHAQPV
eukprot:5420060-Pyramimonas_sp.AAC.1